MKNTDETIHRKSGEPHTINKLAIGLLVGVVALSFAAEPGGLRGWHGFMVGFALTFFSILGIEWLAGRSLSKVKGRDDRRFS